MDRRKFFGIAAGGCIAPFLPKEAGVKKRKGLKFIMAAKKDAPIVSMVEFDGQMWIATTNGVWAYPKTSI